MATGRSDRPARREGLRRPPLADVANVVEGRPRAAKEVALKQVPVSTVTTRAALSKRRAEAGATGIAVKVEATATVTSQEERTSDAQDSTELEARNSKESGVLGSKESETNVRVPKLEKVDIKLPIPTERPARVKALTRAARSTAKQEPTLTATLTAISEAITDGIEENSSVKEKSHLRNIDEADRGNELCVVEYIEDIYSYYRKAEVESCISPDYMSRQVEINHKMRAILIDWLIEVHLKFRLMPETLFLTTSLIDRYLSVENVARRHLQLVGVTAMLVAAKYEEIYAPVVEEIIFISDEAYTRREVLDMEKNMLNTLNFNLTVPTPYVFMLRFLKAASSDKQMELLAFFLVELCLTEYGAVKFSPSLLAAATVYTANHTLGRFPFWSSTLIRYTGYCESELKDCANMIVALHRGAAAGELVVVHKKYSSPTFLDVAALSPALSTLSGTGSEALEGP